MVISFSADVTRAMRGCVPGGDDGPEVKKKKQSNGGPPVLESFKRIVIIRGKLAQIRFLEVVLASATNFSKASTFLRFI